MKNNILLYSLMACASLTAQNNNDPVLMKINGRDVKKSEFEYIYNKNSQQKIDDNQLTLKEYLVLFKNFKLKVAEAEANGLDTTAAFKNELAGYRRQLAKPYLVDQDVDDRLALEAYERMKENVELSHILLRVDPKASPKDTLQIYEKIESIRARLLKGEDFSKLAKEFSEDPSAAQNGGYLGYISAFGTVYPFELMVYKTPVGQISEPVRTSYGYHLVKVISRRPDQGQVLVAHIMKAVQKDEKSSEANEKAKTEINEIYESIKQGADFATVAKEKSDDKYSGENGGELPWFGSGRMVKEFEDQAFALKSKGDMSEPFLTNFGWHIAKLLDKKPMGTFAETKSEIIRKMEVDERGTKGVESLVDKLKKDYQFKLNQDVYDNFVMSIDSITQIDSLFVDKLSKDDKVLISLKDKPNKLSEFASFIAFSSPPEEDEDKKEFMDEKLNEFIQSSVLTYEDSMLESKYPEFKNLINEYRDGILLFDISNREVWEKASKDTEGLEKFFNKYKKKYKWTQPHYKGYVFQCKNEDIQKQAKEIMESAPQDSIAFYLYKKLNNDSIRNIKVEKGLFLNGENAFVDKYAFKKEISDTIKTKQKEISEDLPVVFVEGKMLDKGPESYLDVRGLVTADYQKYLEDRWIKYLNKKFPVEINKDVLKTVKKQG